MGRTHLYACKIKGFYLCLQVLRVQKTGCPSVWGVYAFGGSVLPPNATSNGGDASRVGKMQCLYSSFGFSMGGLKAQWSTEPRASEAAPWVSRVGAVAPCKGKSFNPLCCYSYLIADLAVLKWTIVYIFCSTPASCLKAFALTGRDCSNTRYPGCRFACPGLCAPLGFQPALPKSET